MNRQAFLRLLAAGGASFLGLRALGQGAASPGTPWGRLRYRSLGGDTTNWGVHPQGDLNLIDHLHDNTTVRLERRWNVADVASLAELTAYPFLFMHGERPPELTDAECKNLREYLLRGGFLLAEDCVIGSNTMGFDIRNDHFFRRMAETDLARILPEAKLRRLPDDHPVFHTVFDLPRGLPHMQGTPHGLHGLVLDGRIVALLSPSDIHCGWVNGDNWFGPGKAREAFRMGANFYAFAMTQTA
jgi:Domain of unknown function (DUF4159)